MRLTRPRHPFGLLALLAGVAVALTAPVAVGSDGLIRFQALDALLRDGRLDSSKYSLLGPVAASPLWLVGERFGEPTETVWLFNRCAALVGLIGLWLTLRPLTSADERFRFAVLLLLGSMLPWHLTGFYAEVLHLACVGVGLGLLATRGGFPAVVGAGLCAWGTANVPATAVGLALACAVLVWHRRRFRYLLVPAAAAVLILAENAIRRGHPLDGGYAGDAGVRTALPYSGLPGFSYPVFFGLLAVLFSFGKGLVFFAPGLFVANPPAEARDEELRLVYRAWVAVVVGLVLVYARWWAWYGGAVWGPRFFLFAGLPAALVLARRAARPGAFATAANALVLAALGLSFWVGANGLIFDGHGSAEYCANDFALEHLLWFAPECSVLWMPFRVPKPLGFWDYVRGSAFATGFVYVAGPVLRELALRAWEGAGRVWARTRSGPRWRL